jgi:hypothetical protein
MFAYDDIRAEFQRRFWRQIIVAIVLGIVLVVVFFVAPDKDEWAKYAFFFAVIPGLGFTFWNWRCPACNSYLGKGAFPRFCPKCGTRFKD